MTMFDIDALGLIQSWNITTWSLFRLAVRGLIDSYSRHPIGKDHPAIFVETDTLIYICTSHCAGQHSIGLTLMVRAIMDSSPLRIQCDTERWTVPHSHWVPYRDSTKRVVFIWNQDERALVAGDRVISEHEAAETLLQVLIAPVTK
jgi:hypothetical protein